MNHQNRLTYCSTWLSHLAQELRKNARFPKLSELGATSEALANCLDYVRQILVQDDYTSSTSYNLQLKNSIKNNGIYFLHTDGASRGNPGPAGAGIAILDSNNQIVASYKEYLGIATNNVAEYKSLLIGLKYALYQGVKQIEIRLDSELLIRQLEGRYKVNAPHLLPLFYQIIFLLNHFKKFSLAHISREKNILADKLANQALDEHIKKK